MTSKIIEKHNDYYCSNCMMRQPRVQANCFWCGNIFSNYESMLIQNINDSTRAPLDIDSETGRNRNVPNETFRGQRLKISPIDDSSFISKEQIEQLMKVINNEDNIC